VKGHGSSRAVFAFRLTYVPGGRNGLFGIGLPGSCALLRRPRLLALTGTTEVVPYPAASFPDRAPRRHRPQPGNRSYLAYYKRLTCHDAFVMTLCSVRNIQPTQAYASVCTSTLNTAGRSRTIGFQLSPASAEQYTWPPVVPK
jgi:hypothetical protein